MPKYRWLGTGHQEPVEMTMDEAQMRHFQSMGNQFEGVDDVLAEAEKPSPQEANNADQPKTATKK